MLEGARGILPRKEHSMTIYDIARIAGVSPGTVSRVVNHKPGVKESTRQRIEALLKEHHYTPDMNARSLVMQSSSSVSMNTWLVIG